MISGPNIISVDVEDWFHILELDSTPAVSQWDALESRVERNFRILLDDFDKFDVKATCFFLGWVAQRFPALVKDAASRGHEIASHGFAHQLIYTQTRKEFREDVRKAKDILESLTGNPVLGYRAPGFSVRKDTLWSLDELAQAGYKYDSSIFPAARGHGGLIGAKREPHQIETPSGSIFEFPISVANVLGTPTCFFGGGHLRLFPYWLIRRMSRQVNKEGRPVVYYVHPREIDPSQPRLPMSLARRFKSYVNLSSTKPKLEKLMSERPLTNFKDWIARDRAAGQKWEIRPFTPKDEGGILSLHQSVFGSPLGAAQWRWQFLDNPFSRPIVWVAQGAQGEIVGHYSLVPVPFQSTEGKETAAYSILSMIHPDYQRKGMLKALAKAAEGQLSDDSIGTVATFLNDNSFPLYTFQLGWKEVSSRLPIYFKIINPGRLIQKYLKNETLSRRLGTILRPVIDLVFPQGEEGGGVAVSRERGFDGRVDALWEKASQGTRFGIRRDAPYLNWRIARSPHPYQLFAAEEGQQLLGVAAARSAEKFGVRMGYLVDLLFDPGRPEAGRSLLARVERELASQGCAMVTALAAGGASAPLLRRSGFRRLPAFLMPHPVHFCVRDRSGGHPSMLSQQDWYMSWSDHDVV